MDTVTYPDSGIVRAVADHFVPFKLNLLERHPDFKEAGAGRKVLWAPTLIFADSKRKELRRFTGWLPPHTFMAELHFVRGLHSFHGNRFTDAAEIFAGIDADYGDTEIAAENLYWKGIAGFLAGQRDLGALRESWGALVERFPGTRWATHASVIDDA